MNKKPIFLAMLVLLLAFSLAFVISCKNDDDGNGGGGGANITGTWVASMTHAQFIAAMGEEGEGITSELLTMMGVPNPVDIAKMVFTDDTVTLYELDPKDGTEELTGTGTYTVSGKTITITDPDGITTATVSGNNITVTEDGITVTFKKR